MTYPKSTTLSAAPLALSISLVCFAGKIQQGLCIIPSTLKFPLSLSSHHFLATKKGNKSLLRSWGTFIILAIYLAFHGFSGHFHTLDYIWLEPQKPFQEEKLWVKSIDSETACLLWNASLAISWVTLNKLLGRCLCFSCLIHMVRIMMASTLLIYYKTKEVNVWKSQSIAHHRVHT